jgi:hypothetical protein
MQTITRVETIKVVLPVRATVIPAVLAELRTGGEGILGLAAQAEVLQVEPAVVVSSQGKTPAKLGSRRNVT